MAYEAIERATWQTFCDGVSRMLEGHPVELDIVGLDVGDQVESTDRLALAGVTYDPKDNALYVYVEGQGTHLGHAIREPKELYAEIGDEGLSQVMAIDGDGRRQFVKLREALKLPANA